MCHFKHNFVLHLIKVFLYLVILKALSYTFYISYNVHSAVICSFAILLSLDIFFLVLCINEGPCLVDTKFYSFVFIF